MKNHVVVMIALSDALAVAEAHSGTVEFVKLRLRNQLRKRFVIDAIKFELVNRMNERVASDGGRKMLPGDRPLTPLFHLEDSMQHARSHAAKLAGMVA